MKTAFLFPGQGSQIVGMGKDLVKSSDLAGMIFAKAEAITGLEISKYCFKGPLTLLSRTDILQPCITAVNLACLAELEANALRPDAVAGHSLGEFSACVAAGVFPVETALKLTAERGRLMHEASKLNPGTMAAVIGIAPERLERMISDVSHRHSLVAANFNTADQIVVSGASETIESLAVAVRSEGGRLVTLQVSGAWHSPAMMPAADPWNNIVSQIDLRSPTVTLFMNVTGEPVTDTDAIRSSIQTQLIAPVQWTRTMQNMIRLGIERFIEIGPGNVLRQLLRANHPDPQRYEIFNVSDRRSLDNLLARII